MVPVSGIMSSIERTSLAVFTFERRTVVTVRNERLYQLSGLAGYRKMNAKL